MSRLTKSELRAGLLSLCEQRVVDIKKIIIELTEDGLRGERGQYICKEFLDKTLQHNEDLVAKLRGDSGSLQ
jgi:hypothetical protein